MSFKTVAAVVGALIILPIGWAAYSTFSTVVTAPSRVVNKTLETNNIIFNYERFYDINSQYTSRTAQIDQYKEFLTSETDPTEKVRLRTEVGAMQQSCRELVNTYNNDSRKLNRKIFKDNNLPAELAIQECEI